MRCNLSLVLKHAFASLFLRVHWSCFHSLPVLLSLKFLQLMNEFYLFCNKKFGKLVRRFCVFSIKKFKIFGMKKKNALPQFYSSASCHEFSILISEFSIFRCWLCCFSNHVCLLLEWNTWKWSVLYCSCHQHKEDRAELTRWIKMVAGFLSNWSVILNLYWWGMFSSTDVIPILTLFCLLWIS